MSPRIPELWKSMQKQNERAFAHGNIMYPDSVGFDKLVMPGFGLHCFSNIESHPRHKKVLFTREVGKIADYKKRPAGAYGVFDVSAADNC